MLQEWSLIVNEPAEIQLHAFSDVSIKAYTAVVFMRSVYGDGQVQARFIASKSRVVPLKTQTISRLELVCAVILACLVNKLVEVLSFKVTVTYGLTR